MKQAPISPNIRSGRVNSLTENSASEIGLESHRRNNRSPLHFLKNILARVFICRGSKANTTHRPHGQSREVPSSSSKSKYASSPRSARSSVGQIGEFGFSFDEIYKATRNFSSANVLGDGAFGTVYKGVLKDGTHIAVKRAKKEVSNEFKNEIATLSKIEHLNLVRFLGYLEQGDERLILVEYVGNGNLREHLDGTRGNGLEIGERLDIVIEVAHAVTYLHSYSDPPIIHRDIKASNILITEKLRAKVADFGFARIAMEDPTATHISTQVRGTAGYLDPDYLNSYQLTDKSDVYSFGVLLVEIVTGRQPIELQNPLHERLTVKWAMHRLKGGEIVLVMDPKLKRTPPSLMVVEKVLKLARQCLASSRKSRPSMKKCVEVLWRIRKDFHEMSSLPNCASTSIRTVQVPPASARKNRHEFFGIQESEKFNFRSA